MEVIVVKLTSGQDKWVDSVEGPFESFAKADAHVRRQGYVNGTYCVSSVRPPASKAHTVTNGIFSVTVTRKDGKPFSESQATGVLKNAWGYDVA